MSGCTTNAWHRKGVCYKRSDNVACSAEGCSSYSRARGFCARHDGKTKVCSTAECGSTAVVARGLCPKHGTCKRNVQHAFRWQQKGVQGGRMQYGYVNANSVDLRRVSECTERWTLCAHQHEVKTSSTQTAAQQHFIIILWFY